MPPSITVAGAAEVFHLFPFRRVSQKVAERWFDEAKIEEKADNTRRI